MEDKKSFILYSDLIKVVDKLPDDVAGKLFKIILKYVNDVEVPIDDILLEIAFEPVKNQLKRDLKKWESLKQKRSKAGKISAEKRQRKSTKSTHVENVEQSPANSTVSVNDNVTVNVNDNVLLKKETKEKKFNFKKSLIDFGFKEKLIDDWLKVRKTKKATNSETAFDMFIKEVEKSNKDPDFILRTCIEKDWKGFKNEWLNNLKNNGKSNSSSGVNGSGQGYKPARVDTSKLVQELTDDFENGNVPGQY